MNELNELTLMVWAMVLVLFSAYYSIATFCLIATSIDWEEYTILQNIIMLILILVIGVFIFPVFIGELIVKKLKE